MPIRHGDDGSVGTKKFPQPYTKQSIIAIFTAFAQAQKWLAIGMHCVECATARQKAMGEALFGYVVLSLVKSGIRGAPSSDP